MNILVKLWTLYFFLSSKELFYQLAVADFGNFGMLRLSVSIKSLWQNDAIWRHRSGSILSQVMACCLMAPSHNLNQYSLIFNKVPWHSSEGIMIRRSEDISKTKLKIAFLLTLDVRGLSYLGLPRSNIMAVVSWLLTSPGHQQPWYWLCRIGRFLSYLRNDLNYLRCINVEKWHKM